jgi:hypothetical protein
VSAQWAAGQQEGQQLNIAGLIRYLLPSALPTA